MKKLIIILVISACASISPAQTYDENGNYRSYGATPTVSEPTPWPTRIYNEHEPRGIQWNVERPAPQNNWYDISTGHYTTPPPGVIQSRPFPTYDMPR
jgi:hypothetical protein